MTTTTPDAQLVASHLAGDPAALAGIYDRFADSLHDTAAAMLNDRDDAADVMQDVFLTAASKLDQLRDPDRLKPWLFAILRNEVYRRTKQRKRTVATDFSNDDIAAAAGLDMTDERGLDAEADAAEGTELAELVRGAARGLDERDQLVLELSVRQGLEGQDLADALGVSANQSYTLVHRMRERAEKSLGAFCVAKAGRKDCSELDGILDKWDGEFTVLIRKRVARHIERCEACATNRRKVAPLALFAGAPAFAAPTALREQVLGAVHMQTAALEAGSAPTTPYEFTAEGGFPPIVSAGRKLAAWVAPTSAASLLLVTAGLGFWFLDQQPPDTFESLPAISANTTATTAPAVPTTTPTTTTPTTTTTTTTPTTTTTTPTTTTTTPATTTPVTAAPSATTAPTAPPSSSTTLPPDTAPPVIVTPPRVTIGPTIPPPPTPGELVGSATSLNLAGAQTGSFTLSNPGGQPVSWSAAGASPFTVSPASGTLAAGASTPITIALDRANIAEGTVSASLTFTGDGGQSALLATSASVDRPPAISGIDGPNGSCAGVTGAVQTNWGFQIAATITDESPGTATFTMTGPGGRSGSSSDAFGTPWFGYAGDSDNNPVSGTGTWTWTITATDTRGNTSSTSGSISVTCF